MEYKNEDMGLGCDRKGLPRRRGNIEYEKLCGPCGTRYVSECVTNWPVADCATHSGATFLQWTNYYPKLLRLRAHRDQMCPGHARLHRPSTYSEPVLSAFRAQRGESLRQGRESILCDVWRSVTRSEVKESAAFRSQVRVACD